MATVAARRRITKISRSNGYPSARSETAINVPQIGPLKNTVRTPKITIVHTSDMVLRCKFSLDETYCFKNNTTTRIIRQRGRWPKLGRARNKKSADKIYQGGGTMSVQSTIPGVDDLAAQENLLASS